MTTQTEAQRSADAWDNAITTRAHVDAGNAMAAELHRLEAANAELLEALKELLNRDELRTCMHENTHRGGAIWEICDDCGAKWADDRGGKPAWVDPVEWDLAYAAIAKHGGAA